MKKGGLFLYDHDSLFRMWKYLINDPKGKKRFTFNPFLMTMIDKGDKNGDRYYNYPELESIFKKNGFRIIATYGDWAFENGEYNFTSQRLRIVAKKV